jgi:tetratricopeptide (TPR) repeat protein
MSSPCSNLTGFVDGELSDESAEEFRVHLATCDACPSGLVEAMQLSARLSEIGAAHDQRAAAVDMVATLDPTTVSPAVPPVRDWNSKPIPKSQSNPRPQRRRHAAWMGTGSALVAAAAVLLVYLRPPAVSDVSKVFAEVTARPYDVRFAYAPAAGYLPTQVSRGPAERPTRLPYAVLDELEKRDSHGLAIAQVMNGELSNSIATLNGLNKRKPNSSVESDQAALEIAAAENSNNYSNVERTLAALARLQRSADPNVARAAQWNGAVLRENLKLPFSAEAAYRDIARQGERGWSAEAGTRAEGAKLSGRTVRATWRAADRAGNALVSSRTLVPEDLIKSVPGLMRAHFYLAVRTAENRDQVHALIPMASELDRIDGGSTLTDYARRIERVDFQRRAPLARAYKQLIVDHASNPAIAALLAAPAPRDVADIAMGAMIELDSVPDHLDAFQSMVKQAGDPWFEVVLAKEAAQADIRRRDWRSAQVKLERAWSSCPRASTSASSSPPAVPAQAQAPAQAPAQATITYPCLRVALKLGTLDQDLHDLPAALGVLRAALDQARNTNEWGQYGELLHRLADVERFNSSIATARSYAQELLAMADNDAEDGAEGVTKEVIDDDSYRRAVQLILVGVAIRDLDGQTARRELDRVRGLQHSAWTADTYLATATYLADIGRLDRRIGDFELLESWLEQWRRMLQAAGPFTASDQARADALKGRLLIESDRAKGIELLNKAIAASRALPTADAGLTYTGAYSVLALDAARHQEYAQSAALIATEQGLPEPGRCSVAMVAEDERAAVIAIGSDGSARAVYYDKRRPDDGPLTVAPELADSLRDCSRVGVVARSMLQGQPGILPSTLAWSYITGARKRGPAQSAASDAPRTLIVADVTPPASLQLPALSHQKLAVSRSATILSGPAATPDRVLDAMREAIEIQIHTHALVDASVSDASYLVLSPGRNGDYALTAERIRGAELHRSPIVVLAACDSAQGARYQHASWNLPYAFLSIGARAVFATGSLIPDSEAGPFFTRVLDRIRAGAEPAVALRDERVSAGSKLSSWTADVMLFE